LAAAGAITVGAQQLSLALAIALANTGPEGSVVLYNLSQTVYLLPWAVLALPIAISAYPSMAETAARDDLAGFGRVLAPAARALVIFSCLGAAVLFATAVPLSHVLGPMLVAGSDAHALAAG